MEYFGLWHCLAPIVLAAIGLGHRFAMVDAWRMAGRAIPQNDAERMGLTYATTWRTSLGLTLLVSLVFVISCVSSLTAVAAFSLFLALNVLVQWASLLLFFPTVREA